MAENMDDTSSSQNHEFKCTICVEYFNKPVMTLCGHKFCDACIKSWLNTSPTCPLCKTGINVQSDIFPDKYTERKIKELLVSCPYANEGCSQTIPKNKLNQHQERCLFKPFYKNKEGNLICPFYEMGCHKKFDTVNLLDNHKMGFVKEHLKLALTQIGYYQRKYQEEERLNLHQAHKETVLKKFNDFVPILKNGRFIWVVDNIIEKLQSKTSVSTFYFSSVNGFKLKIDLTFSGNNAAISISMVSKPSDKGLKWPCKIGNCKICVLKTLSENGKEDGVLTAGNEYYLSGNNIANIIELHTSLDELRRHAIDNQLFVKVVMIFN